jgi:hypothetical protein
MSGELHKLVKEGTNRRTWRLQFPVRVILCATVVFSTTTVGGCNHGGYQ